MSLWLKKKKQYSTTIIEYLGLTIDTGKIIAKIPENKISELKDKIMFVMGNSKVTLRTLQSLAGSLAFCTKALPAGRTFSRRIYALQAKLKSHTILSG